MEKHDFKEPWTFGQKIILLREDMGMTQKELARRANVSVDTLREMEQQQSFTSSLAIRLIASALHVPIEAFMDEPVEEADDGAKALENMFFEYLKHLVEEGKHTSCPEELDEISHAIYLTVKARQDSADYTPPYTLYRY